jgi:hypothetical protein
MIGAIILLGLIGCICLFIGGFFVNYWVNRTRNNDSEHIDEEARLEMEMLAE